MDTDTARSKKIRASPAAGVTVEADLTVSVDAGGRGQTAARITGSGQELQVHTDRPDILGAAAGRRAASAAAAALATSGVRVELHGPRGRLAVIDPDRVTRVGALLASPRPLGHPRRHLYRHLRLRPAAWAVLARALIRSTTASSWWPSGPGRAGPLAVLAAGAAGVASIAAFIRRRRHRRWGC